MPRKKNSIKGRKPAVVKPIQPADINVASPSVIDKSTAALLVTVTSEVRLRSAGPAALNVIEEIEINTPKRKTIEVTLPRLQVLYDEGKQKGSSQYDVAQMVMLCHQVVILLIDWLQFEIDGDKELLCEYQRNIPVNNRYDKLDLSISAACTIVSK